MDSSEDLLASIVEYILERDEGRVLGRRTQHDFNDGVRWAVDLSYDDAKPPVALELTSVQDDAFLSTRSAVSKLAALLTSVSNAEDLGGWEIIVWDDGQIRAMEVPLLEVLRAGENIDVGDYSSTELLLWKRNGTIDQQLALHRHLADVRIARVRRDDNRQGVTISTAGENSGPWSGVVDLQQVVVDNAQKLAVTQLEGHLAIGVGRYQVSTVPADTPVPALPSAINRLWLIRLWYVHTIGYEVWSARRGARAWQVHRPVPVNMPRGGQP